MSGWNSPALLIRTGIRVVSVCFFANSLELFLKTEEILYAKEISRFFLLLKFFLLHSNAVIFWSAACKAPSSGFPCGLNKLRAHSAGEPAPKLFMCNLRGER